MQQQTRCTLIQTLLPAADMCNISVLRLMMQCMIACHVTACHKHMYSLCVVASCTACIQAVYVMLCSGLNDPCCIDGCHAFDDMLGMQATCNVQHTGLLTLSHAAASIGFTRRVGNTRLVHASLTQLLQAFHSTLPDPATTARGSSWASERCVALVFGREESGLTANELSLCTHSCSIPTGPVQPSLNLSHAVCVVLAQLFEQRSCNHDAGLRSVPFT